MIFPNPLINLDFVEENYEIESLLRNHRRRTRNQDVRAVLEYSSEEYDEEIEMEPRPTRVVETTPILRTGSPRPRRARGRVVEFEGTPNRDEIRVERRYEAFGTKGRRRWKLRRESSSSFSRTSREKWEGRVHVGDRSKPSFWNGFAIGFNSEINTAIVDGQEGVNFTGEQCRIYGLTLKRHNKLKILLGPEKEKVADIFNFKVPTMSYSKSKSGTSTGRSTATTGRKFTSEEVMDFSSQRRRVLVLEILTNLDDLDVSDLLKVNSYCAKDEVLDKMILMCNPAKRLRKVKEICRLINE
ncbi:hypothetical protein Tco_0588925 [Tanacetum coccineum]